MRNRKTKTWGRGPIKGSCKTIERDWTSSYFIHINKKAKELEDLGVFDYVKAGVVWFSTKSPTTCIFGYKKVSNGIYRREIFKIIDDNFREVDVLVRDHMLESSLPEALPTVTRNRF